jgi:ribosomal protein S17
VASRQARQRGRQTLQRQLKLIAYNRETELGKALLAFHRAISKQRKGDEVRLKETRRREKMQELPR